MTDEKTAAFWTDDNSNCGGVFLSGPSAGRVFLLDHEEPLGVPHYFSVSSFYEAQLDGYARGLGWHELQHDYPVCAEKTGLPDDSIAAQHYYEQFQSNGDGVVSACRFLALLPWAQTERALALLNSENMWVQEAACELLRARKVPAVEAFARVVRT